MRNLHKYYYKDYFSETIIGIDENGGTKLSFKNICLKEEKDRIQDETRKKELTKSISAIETRNSNILKRRNTELIGTGFVKNNHQDKSKKELFNEAVIPNDYSNEDHSFLLKISYPGLVTGIGINHEAKIEGEFKLGMHFDWTYGMPVIYGSSVKGVLRSAFIAKVEKGKIVEYDVFFLKKTKPEYEWDQESIKTLFNAIFEGKNQNGENISIYERDIFFDAVIKEADTKGRILCSDSITPHGDNPLKNPTPLTFMKIAPGCKMEFRFKLKPTEIVNSQGKKLLFDEAAKHDLFRLILTTVGIGAKTNVGYGQFKRD